MPSPVTFDDLIPPPGVVTFDDLIPQNGGASINDTLEGLVPANDLNSHLESLVPVPGQQTQSGTLPDYTGASLIPSAINYAQDFAHTVMHPVDTLGDLWNVAQGVKEKLTPGPTGPHEQYANAVGQFYNNRYGGWDAIKNTLQTDPVGAAADAATALTLGAALPERLPGILGEAGRAVGTVGRAIDPIGATVNAAKNIGRGTAGAIGDTLGSPMFSGMGGNTLREGATAGAEAARGNTGPINAFQGSAWNSTDPASIVAQARSAVGNMRQARSSSYVSDMAALNQAPPPIDFAPIYQGLKDTDNIKSFGGQQLSPSTAVVRQQMDDTIRNWDSLPTAVDMLRANANDPRVVGWFNKNYGSSLAQADAYLPGGDYANFDSGMFKAAPGVDALKQKLGDILGGQPQGTPEHAVASQIYNVVKDQIVKQDPRYATIMKNYADASDLIHEMESTLSAKTGAPIDTTLRKLDSVMRNNVNANFDQRYNLATQLAQYGAPDLMPALAGRAAASWPPRGIAAIPASMSTGGTALALGVGALHNPFLLGAAALHSPKVLGQAALAAGFGAGLAGHIPGTPLMRAGYQMRGIPGGILGPQLSDNGQ